jgi:SM-20-related protein
MAVATAMDVMERRVNRVLVSGREVFICDNFIALSVASQVGAFVKTLPYARSETSLAGMPPSAASAEVPATPLMTEFMIRLKEFAEEMFPGERFCAQRAYVNHSVYGDMYHMHRDLSSVTVLYYANLEWETDWGGETIYFDDDNDAQIAVSPRPGRMVISRGAVLHRGSVPTRDCKQARLTIAYKLRLRGDLADSLFQA